MDPTAPPRASWTGLARAGPWLAALLVLGYGALLWRHAGVCAGGSDSSGYLNQARLLQQGRLRAEARTLPELRMAQAPAYAYVPLGFVPRVEESRLVPTYPTGLSLLVLLGAAVAGWQAGPAIVLVAHALAGLILTYLLGRTLGLARGAAALAALALAASPLYVMFALQAMSDLPALVWSAAAVLCAWHAARHTGFAVGAGLALGIAVLLRPTNTLMLAPVLVALGWSWRRWLWLVLGGLPAAAWFLYVNFRSFGHPLLTGYGDLGRLMSGEWLQPGLAHYGRLLPVLLSPLVTLVLGLPWLAREHRRAALVLGAWIAGLLGFYAFYFHTHETWWYLRFVLPAFPPLILGALLVAQRLLRPRPPGVRLALGAAAAILIAANGWHWNRHWQVLATGEQERLYPRAAAWVREQLPADAVLVAMQASGALYFYTDRVILRWDTLEDRWPAVRAALAKSGRPVFAVLFDFERQPALEERTPGSWSRVHVLGPLSIWRLQPSSPSGLQTQA